MTNNVAPLLGIAFLITTNAAFGASIAPTALVCTPTSLGWNASSTCTVTLNQAAPTGGSSVTLSSITAALKVPSVTSPPVPHRQPFRPPPALSAPVKARPSRLPLVAFPRLPLSASWLRQRITYVQGNYAEPQTPSDHGERHSSPALSLAGDLNVVVVGWFDSTAVVSSRYGPRG